VVVEKTLQLSTTYEEERPTFSVTYVIQPPQASDRVVTYTLDWESATLDYKWLLRDDETQSSGIVTTTILPDQIREVETSVEFGGSRLSGALSRIVGFYPSFLYQPGRVPPAMTGREPWRLDTDYKLRWGLIAP
jgi:hypothetical protein